MTISCDTAKTLAIVFGVYSGILTGVLLGFFLLWCLKRKVQSKYFKGGVSNCPRKIRCDEH